MNRWAFIKYLKFSVTIMITLVFDSQGRLVSRKSFIHLK